MVFPKKIKKLAQKLQKVTLLALLTVFFIFPASGLLAEEADLPVIIPNDELLTPIELRDGLVFEVVVSEESEFALHENSSSESQVEDSFHLSSFSKTKSAATLAIAENVKDFSHDSKPVSQIRNFGLCEGASLFENALRHSEVKSIASLGLFGFLGICLSRSELPSKNFSMPCENSLLKSMTQRSANDWKFLWQPVRMTSLWLMSTSSSRMLKTSIQRPFRNHTHSMSDTSSTWSNAMEGFLMTFSPSPEGMKTELVVTALPSLQRSSRQFSPNPSTVPLNPQVL